MFAQLSEYADINVEKTMHPYRVTFEMESTLVRDPDLVPANTTKVTYSAVHVPLSVSSCSNVPGFEVPVCLTRRKYKAAEELVERLVE